MWNVYIVKCSDETFYTGVTNDLERRINEHNGSKLASKYTRARRPVILMYQEKYKTRSLAQKEESRIKNLNREGKQKLINNA